MLSPTPDRTRPLKQGWILKKAGSGILAQWKPKYIVLQQTQHGFALFLFDNRDQTKKPKHEIMIHDMRIDTKSGRFAFLSRSAVPFTIYTHSRKVSFVYYSFILHVIQKWNTKSG
jgi:hypothetical protein